MKSNNSDGLGASGHSSALRNVTEMRRATALEKVENDLNKSKLYNLASTAKKLSPNLQEFKRRSSEGINESSHGAGAMSQAHGLVAKPFPMDLSPVKQSSTIDRRKDSQQIHLHMHNSSQPSEEQLKKHHMQPVLKVTQATVKLKGERTIANNNQTLLNTVGSFDAETPSGLNNAHDGR